PTPRSPLLPYTTLFRSLDHFLDNYRRDPRGGDALPLRPDHAWLAQDPRSMWQGYAWERHGREEGGGWDAPFRDEAAIRRRWREIDRKSTRLNSSHVKIS